LASCFAEKIGSGSASTDGVQSKVPQMWTSTKETLRKKVKRV
jgi:hypothetical protein